MEVSRRPRQTEFRLGDGDDVPTISAVVTQLLEAKRAANLRPVYLTSLAGYLARFAKGNHYHQPVKAEACAEFWRVKVES